MSIPYPAETDPTETRRDKVDYFVSEAIRRFEQAHFAWLHLNGFYWLDESISGRNLSLVKAVAK
ncbi:MAG: DUF4855 domain-containing protein [Verrucomicrobiota bacterium]